MKKKLFTFLMTLILLTGSGTWAQAQTKGTHTFRLGDNQFWSEEGQETPFRSQEALYNYYLAENSEE